jgi:hypothetical protein
MVIGLRHEATSAVNALVIAWTLPLLHLVLGRGHRFGTLKTPQRSVQRQLVPRLRSQACRSDLRGGVAAVSRLPERTVLTIQPWSHPRDVLLTYKDMYSQAGTCSSSTEDAQGVWESMRTLVMADSGSSRPPMDLVGGAIFSTRILLRRGRSCRALDIASCAHKASADAIGRQA